MWLSVTLDAQREYAQKLGDFAKSIIKKINLNY